MKKKIVFFISIIIVTIAILILTYHTLTKDKGTKLFESTFSLDLPNGIKSDEVFNNYNSPPNEGLKLYSFKLTDKNSGEFISKAMKKWNKLPLSEDLELVMYGGTKDGTLYTYNFANKVGLPKIEKGYWILDNEHNSILNENSFNFTLAIYDSENSLLYLFKIDT